ncbi:MAG: alkaline phosphatase family protein [Acidimicrobiales bacterium]
MFTSKPLAKAKAGIPLHFTVKTKANPTAKLSAISALPKNVTFADNGNGTGTLSDSSPLGGSFTVELQATNTTTQVNTTDQIVTVAVKSKYPAIRHVFVIMLENNRYSATFGSPSADPYLATTLPSEGALLEKYYGVGHFSNDNYVGFISGQPPNTDNQLDCLGSGFVDFPVGAGETGGIQQGAGCVYPSGVTTLANQLDSAGFTWKGYMEDMGNDPTRDGGVTCGHPAVGASSDPTTSAEAGDGYTTRHDPFVYFHSIIDNATECDTNVVPLGDTSGNMPAGTPAGVTGLATDLQSVATTPNVSFITPNLCDDGHDYPCTNTTGAGQGGGSSVGDINQWLQTWVPMITSSPAFKQDGLLEITFDEAEEPGLDATACCGETPGPAAAAGGNGESGPGGGVVGAVLLSPFIKDGTKVTKSYNHFSSLATFEDLFNLPRLGEAQTVTSTFSKGGIFPK